VQLDFKIKIETIKHWDFSLSRTVIQPSTWNLPVEEKGSKAGSSSNLRSSSPSQGLNFWGFRKPTESSPSTNQSRPGFEPTGMGQKLSAFVKR